MSRGMNVTVLSGNVGGEDTIEYKKNKRGDPVCEFALAVEDRGGFVTWVRVNANKGLEQVCRNYLTAGRWVEVRGELINKTGGQVQVRAEELIFPPNAG